jgi:hypothetical protein
MRSRSGRLLGIHSELCVGLAFHRRFPVATLDARLSLGPLPATLHFPVDLLIEPSAWRT